MSLVKLKLTNVTRHSQRGDAVTPSIGNVVYIDSYDYNVKYCISALIGRPTRANRAQYDRIPL